jgi:hypothetical protein
MNPSVTRLKIVYICLMAVTILSLGLTSDMAHSVLSVRAVAIIAAIIAFVKARYVVLEFMELRGTMMQRAFDLWLLVVCVGSLTLAFR